MADSPHDNLSAAVNAAVRSSDAIKQAAEDLKREDAQSAPLPPLSLPPMGAQFGDE